MKIVTLSVLTCAAAMLPVLEVWAGRPLTVDDASTNDAGAGHVEAWVARDAAQTTVFNASPAYAPVQGLEFSALVSRNQTQKTLYNAVQGKWIITPSQAEACNAGLVLGRSHQETAGSATFFNGLLTCNASQWGSLHLNAGAIKPRGESHVPTWGVAVEKPLGGFTPHLEWFGQRGDRPTVQTGARMEITKTLQLDGTVGQHAGQRLYSLGLKAQF
jgi:hypothetical protein